MQWKWGEVERFVKYLVGKIDNNGKKGVWN